MKSVWALTGSVALAGLAACASVSSEAEEIEKEISLAEVPANVQEAAKGAVPGIVLSEAEVETEDGVTVYEVEGTADGKEYEIEVSADGKVLEVEEDD